MERETSKVKTPTDGIEIVLKTWVTAREKREVDSILLNSANFNTDGTTGAISGELINKVVDKKIEMSVVSVGGETENCLEKLLDMKSKDYDFILEKVNEVFGEEKKTK